MTSIDILRILTCLDSENHASSIPIVAIRHVINTFLSERDAQFSMSKSSSSRCRGSRLENKIGLNITDDEYVISKLKEKEQKQSLSRLRRISKVKGITTSTNKTKAKRFRKIATTTMKANKENETSNDRQIAAAVQRLENVIQFTQTTFDNDISDGEC